MAAYSAGAGTRATLWHTVDVNSQNAAANQSSLHVNTYIAVTGGTGITNMVGDAVWHVATAGGGGGPTNFTYSGWSGANYTLNTYDITVNHDVNGNCTISVYAHANGANSPYFTSATVSTNLALPRLALAPTISSTIADTITATSVRLGGEISSHGHGTSTTHTMYYRLSGSGSWTSAGAQSDTSGYNYWTITGLQPGKTYQYYMNSTNNNGDSANSSTQTFATKAVPSMAALLVGLL